MLIFTQDNKIKIQKTSIKQYLIQIEEENTTPQMLHKYNIVKRFHPMSYFGHFVLYILIKNYGKCSLNILSHNSIPNFKAAFLWNIHPYGGVFYLLSKEQILISFQKLHLKLWWVSKAASNITGMGSCSSESQNAQGKGAQ